MIRRPINLVLGALMALSASSVLAQDVLIQNATVHTATAQGTLHNTDVLVRQGKIAAIGPNLSADGVETIDAQGQPLSPTMFGGISGIGLEEVSSEVFTRDASLALGQNAKDIVVRPEFDVTLAYNPDSVLVPVARVEGIGFTLLTANSTAGGSIVGGQGGTVRLDGGPDPIGPKVLFVSLGGAASELSGVSRAGQWMFLDQLVDELRGRIPAEMSMLTPVGQRTLKRYIDEGGTIMFSVDRAADIRQLLRWAQQHTLNIAINGGVEAWKLAPQLAAAKVPVFLDSLQNLPSNFDKINASLENAARLRAAGVAVAFNQAGDASHNARKQRQLAGNAVAHGLPWEDGLAGLTRVPAEALGVADQIGTIAVGKTADLVLWTGDPLDVAHTARQVWFAGRAIPMRSRQTELRDRYLQPQPDPAAGDLPRAYSGAR